MRPNLDRMRRAVGRKLDPIWYGWVDIGFTTDEGSDPNPEGHQIGEIDVRPASVFEALFGAFGAHLDGPVGKATESDASKPAAAEPDHLPEDR